MIGSTKGGKDSDVINNIDIKRTLPLIGFFPIVVTETSKGRRGAAVTIGFSLYQ